VNVFLMKTICDSDITLLLPVWRRHDE
jgi:hypothetical protein